MKWSDSLGGLEVKQRDVLMLWDVGWAVREKEGQGWLYIFLSKVARGTEWTFTDMGKL